MFYIIYRPANNESEVDPQGMNEPNEEVSSFTVNFGKCMLICLLFTPLMCRVLESIVYFNQLGMRYNLCNHDCFYFYGNTIVLGL